jgi:hypothetical protein
MNKKEIKNLLSQCLSEINNLQDKITHNEPEGWEGSKRRLVLKSRLDDAIKLLSYDVT